MNTLSAVSTPRSDKNALTTPLRSAAAVFSEEVETRNRVERMQRERERFNAWWSEEFPNAGMGVMDQRLAWESWKASARLERSNA